MSFEGLIGHRRAVEQLGRSLERGRLHHALLFQGPHGVGKRTLARALATELLCRDADDPAVARKLVENHAHPDLLVVRRVSRKIDKPPVPMGDLSEEQELEALSNKELSTQIRVVQIRALIEHAGFTPRQASCRVFLVDPADRMNLAAQNALLKTLEEPPGRTFLMLLAARPHLLLPTVRSRCYAVRLGPLPAVELARELEARGMSRGEAVARASLSGGRPGRALSLDVEALRERRAEIVQGLERLARSPLALARLSDLVAPVSGKTEADFLEGLDLVEEALRDAARVACGLPGDSAIDPELAERLDGIGRALGAERAAAIVRSIERFRSDLRFNISRPLATESLLAAVAGGPLP